MIVDTFHMLTDYLDSLLHEVLVFLSLFSYWYVSFFLIDLQVFFVYYKNKFFVAYLYSN
jgi:hypothetical protein